MIKKRLKIQEINKRIEVTRSIDGKMAYPWETHGKEISENQNKIKIYHGNLSQVKEFKWKWNKKRGIREKSSKGSQKYRWWDSVWW